MKRANKPIVFFVLWIFYTVNVFAQFAIKGNCIDENKIPLVAVNITVSTPEDSIHILKGMTTNADGTFRCTDIPQGNYLLRFTMLGYQPQIMSVYIDKDRNLGTIVMKEHTELLEEISVTANMLKTYGNKDEIFLPRQNKAIGTNALDALSSMPQFKKNINEELETADRKSILILIDSRRASSKELSILQPNDIKKINFYSSPPSRYAHEHIGAVVDVVTNRKKDKRYSIYINTKNSFTTGYGTNMGSFTHADSLNQFTASYFVDYRALNNNRMNNLYQYENGKNCYIGLPGKYNGHYNVGQLTYQRYQGKNLFNAKLEYRKNPGKEKHEQQATYTVAQETEYGINKRNLKSDYDAWSLDLYYTRNFSDTRSLNINAVNTYYTSSSNNVLSRMTGEEMQIDYSYENLQKNNSYSFIAEALYNDQLWGGSWNVGAYFLFKDFHQTFNGDKSYLNHQKEYMYTDYSNKWNKLSYTVGIGIDNIIYHTVNGDKYNYTVARPSLSLNYQWSKTISLRLNSSIQSKVPEIGYLTNSIVSIDEYFFSKGNPELKPYSDFNNELKFQYISSDNKVYLAPSIFYKHSRHPNALVLFKEENNVFMKNTKLGDADEYGYSIVGSYAPAEWITLQPYYQYIYDSYRTPNNTIKHSTHNAGVSVQLIIKKVQVLWSGNLPFTTVSGDLYTRNGGNMFASAQWKVNSFSIGAEWIYSPKPSKVYSGMDGFHYIEETLWNNFKNLVNIKFTYYLSKGKARKHQAKSINNSDTDSGLIRTNTAK